MFFETRLSRYLTTILVNLKEKFFIVQSSLSLVLLSLFTGFLCGNLFGTFLDTLRLYFIWNGFVGLFLLLFIEVINSFVYGISFSKKYEHSRNNFLKVFFHLTESCSKNQLYDNANKRNNTRSTLLVESHTFDLKKDYNSQSKEKLNLIEVHKKTISLASWLRVNSEKSITSLQPIKKWKIPKSSYIHIFKGLDFSKNIIHIERIVNSFKIGLLFGFFVDSFKVGS